MRDSSKAIFVVLVLLLGLGFPVLARSRLFENGALAKVPERAGHENNSQTISAIGSGLALGVWGGEHVRLEVTTQGATVEFDCAQGTISQRIVVDRRGRFVIDGVYVAEHGGPVRMNEQASSLPVRFSGRISGKRMTLTVRRRDTKKLIGTFTLRHGQEGALVKCR